MERVMIVEDHSAFAQALELVLGQVDGTKVALARTLEEGRALIGSGKPFDLVLLDLTLPDGEGTELIAEIRQSHPETPVTVLSARDDVDEAASKAGPIPQSPRRSPARHNLFPQTVRRIGELVTATSSSETKKLTG